MEQPSFRPSGIENPWTSSSKILKIGLRFDKDTEESKGGNFLDTVYFTLYAFRSTDLLGGLKFRKFFVNQLTSFRNMWIFHFRRLSMKMPIPAHCGAVFWRFDPLNVVKYCRTALKLNIVPRSFAGGFQCTRIGGHHKLLSCLWVVVYVMKRAIT